MGGEGSLSMSGYGKAIFGVVAGLALAVAVAGCGGGTGGTGGGGGGGATAGTSGGGGAGGAAAPTTLPANATLGCAEAPASTCVYGGAASAPSGLKVADINTKITPDRFKVTAPLAVTADKSAPGGKYLAVPTGGGAGTGQTNGDATVAVKIPSDGYYVIMAGTQSGDTTTGTDSFFVGFGDPPTADADHLWSITPDGNWHQNDSSGGCVQLVHSGTNDAPNGCDTWHFKKGILVIHIDGREDNAHVAYIDVVPANPAKPMGDARQ